MALTRYAYVGAFATLAHYLLLVGLVELAGSHPAAAAILGAWLGAAVAYWSNRRWTFPTTAVPHTQAAWRFMVVAAAGSLVNGAIVAAGTQWVGVHYLLAQVAATGTVMLLTYHVNRWWTFQLTR